MKDSLNTFKKYSKFFALTMSTIFLSKAFASSAQEIKINYRNIKEFTYAEIKGFKVVYDMHIDQGGELLVPDFQSGIIFVFSKNLKRLPNIDSYLIGGRKKLFENIHAVYKVKSRLYVLEMKKNRIIEIFNGSLVNSFGANKLIAPVNIEQLADNFLYVSNWHGNAIDKFDLEGKYISSLDLTSRKASWVTHIKKDYGLLAPHSIKLNENTEQYFIADQYSKRVIRIDKNQEVKTLNWSPTQANTIWEPITENEKNKPSIFNSPTYVEIINNILFVSDTVSNRILLFALGTGNFLGCIGDTSNLFNLRKDISQTKTNLIYIPIKLNNPYSVRYSKVTSNVYIADRENGRIVIFDSKNLTLDQDRFNAQDTTNKARAKH